MARVEISEVVITPGGDAVSGAAVQVNQRNGGAAAVYADATTGTTLSNPLYTDSAGRVEGWVEEGRYDLVVFAQGMVSYTQRFEAVVGPGPGWVNVKDAAYGATGDGTTDDTTAIQAAINAADGRDVVFPAGTYIVDGGLTVGAGDPVVLRGAGMSHIGGATVTQLVRASGTTPLITVTGTGNTSITRGLVEIRDLELDGGGSAGTVLRLDRCNEVLVDRVRVYNSTAKGLHATQLWNSTIRDCFFHECGSTTTHPAVLFDAISPAADTQDASATVLVSNCQFEANTGTDLKLTGNVASSAPTNEIQFSNIKMEGGSGSYPYIDLDYAQNCQFSNVKISAPTARTGVMVQQVGTSTGIRANKFSNLTLDNAGSATPTYFLQVAAGSLQLSNLTCAGTNPTTAYVRIDSTVSAGRVRVRNMLVADDTITKFSDARTVDEELGHGHVQVLSPRMGGDAASAGVGTNTVYSFADAATQYASGQVVIPRDAVAGRPVSLRLYWTSAVNAGDVRWKFNYLASLGVGDDASAAAASTSAVVTVPGTANTLKITDITGPACDPGELLQVYLQRIGGDGSDTAAGTAALHGAVVKYERHL